MRIGGHYILLSVLSCILLVSGCKNFRAPPPVLNQPAVNSEAEEQKVRMAQCQRDLETLKDVDPKEYDVKKRQFSALMNNAARYSTLRKDISNLSQGTVDALYKYKADKLCFELSADVLTGMIKGGEKL
jgi:hypothetical protein